MVYNQVNRYSIGDRTPGIRYGEDGSLTIYIQHDTPSQTANPTGSQPPRAASTSTPAPTCHSAHCSTGRTGCPQSRRLSSAAPTGQSRTSV
jgi:hypothetical protein